MGMLSSKGVPFWTPGMEKAGSFFRLEVCEKGTFSGENMGKDANFQKLVCEWVPICEM